MNCEEEILVRSCSDNIRCEEERPRYYGRIAEKVGAEDLEGNDEENEVLGKRLRPAELSYLEGNIVSIASRRTIDTAVPLGEL